MCDDRQKPVNGIESAPSRSALLVVIDADVDLAEVLRIRLEQASTLLVHVGTNLESALGQEPDVVLLDFHHHADALRWLRETKATASIPVIAGCADFRDAARALWRGADVCLRRPYRADDLLESLDTLISNTQRAILRTPDVRCHHPHKELSQPRIVRPRPRARRAGALVSESEYHK